MTYLQTKAPGVYIEQIPSATRTIVGASTSITAFVGGAARGPLQTPTSISSFAEYEQIFGGLHRASLMSQTVRHFFANGGSQALIVRVTNRGQGLVLSAAAGLTGAAGVVRFEVEVSNVSGNTFDLAIRGLDASGQPVPEASGEAPVDLSATPETSIEGIQVDGNSLVDVELPDDAAVPPVGIIQSFAAQNGQEFVLLGPQPAAARARLADTDDALLLEAADPGRWGNRLTASVSNTDAPSGTFHLTIQERDDAGNLVREESHLAVSATPQHPRHLVRVLARRSALARVVVEAFGTPAVTADPVAFRGGSDGAEPTPDDSLGSEDEPYTGMYTLRLANGFNILCLPRGPWEIEADSAFWVTAIRFAEDQRAFLIVDPPDDWGTAAEATAGAAEFGVRSDNAALYFPRVRVGNPLDEGRPAEFPPCGVVAGIMARTDGERGIWKAPAGIDATARGVIETTVRLTDAQQGTLNQLGIDAFRTFPTYGTVLWGARTLSGADVLASEWKYVPVRRLALYLQESLYRGTQWAVFEPNGEALWAQLRLSVGGFMHGLYRQGAFAGSSIAEAYSVQCNRQTTTPDDVNRGVVNVLVRFAPVRPAEFVVLRIQQMVSQGG